ncbi:MAG: glucose-6-phosphate dehydrogenase, partial [Pseudomonadota bacterium]|nr:glucose-6-phosphate dehydrogenase [Pseudomonadota bacterium]
MTSAIPAGRPSTTNATAPGKQAPPCTLVIFGAGGDLTKRLLMPSLYDLASARRLDDGFKIHGVDLAQQDTQAWRTSLSETMQSFTKDKTAEFYVPKLDDAAWQWVTERLSYEVGDFSRDETFASLKQVLGERSAIFYCAVSARFFGT